MADGDCARDAMIILGVANAVDGCANGQHSWSLAGAMMELRSGLPVGARFFLLGGQGGRRCLLSQEKGERERMALSEHASALSVGSLTPASRSLA